MSMIKKMLIVCVFICVVGYNSLPTSTVGIEVEFPDVSHSPDNPVFKPILPDSKEEKEVKIDGMLAYRISWQMRKPVETKIFDQIEPGLTLREVITMLGPGYQLIGEGVGFIYWNCEDGRILNMWPKEYKLSEKPKYWIVVRGLNQKHDVIRKLAHDFIAGIRIVDAKALIVLKQDTYLVKAGKPRYYGIGDCFQKVEPLPRIDFRIKGIDADGVHCEYFYQALPEGLIHYFEHGNVILNEKSKNTKDSDKK